MGKILMFIAALLALSFIAGCNTSGCVENQSTIPLAGFYSYNSGKAISIDSIEVRGIGAPNDSLLTEPCHAVSKIYLPFRSNRQSVAFCFHYTQKALDFDELNDTLTFDYEAIPHFVSEECGVVYYYNITRMDHTTNMMDSVAVTDSMIINIDSESIRIFFRTE